MYVAYVLMKFRDFPDQCPILSMLYLLFLCEKDQCYFSCDFFVIVIVKVIFFSYYYS